VFIVSYSLPARACNPVAVSKSAAAYSLIK
jgi:hypothetical protein